MNSDPVRNENGISVGNVVGDGILFEISGFPKRQLQDLSEAVTAVTVRLYINTGDLKAQNGRYTTLDLGLEVPEELKTSTDLIEVRPLNAEGSTAGMKWTDIPVFDGQESIFVEGVWEYPFQDLAANHTLRLYPIVRMEKWMDAKEEPLLSTAEEAVIATFAALYGVGCLTFLTLLILCVVFIPRASNAWLLTFGFLLHLFRCVYLALFAAGYLQDNSVAALVMIELPSFFLFSIASITIMSYAFAIFSMKWDVGKELLKKKRRVFWKIWAVYQVLLYLILAVVIICMTQIESVDETKTSCFRRQGALEEDNSTDIIRIAYHSFMLLMAVIVGVLLFTLSKRIMDRAKEHRIVLLSSLSAFAVITVNILWVIYSAFGGSTPFFVIPLFLCESPAMLYAGITIRPRNFRQLRKLREAERSERMPSVFKKIKKGSSVNSAEISHSLSSDSGGKKPFYRSNSREPSFTRSPSYESGGGVTPSESMSLES